MAQFFTVIVICRSALLTLLIVTTLVNIRNLKSNDKWYSLIFLCILLLLDL